ncbi:MAG: hypothetical protein ICV70_00160 [Jiangellaceae bacterium]|nr:hypothetical protein [Jiangellaceae bacterium]
MTGSLAPIRRGPHILTALAGPALAVPLLLCSAVTALAAPSSDPGDDLGAVGLLHRALAAPELVWFRGTQYVAAWSPLDAERSTSAVVDVIHEPGGPTRIRAHGAQPLAMVDERSGTAWLAGAGGPVGLLVRGYDVEIIGVSAVAGRPANIVEARRDDGTPAARLWLDSEWALPLRREIYAEDGTTRTASAFIEVHIEPAPAAVEATQSDPEDRWLRHDDLAELRAGGWSCPRRLPGGFQLYEARRVGDAFQLSYSDGVATVSVFEQRGRLDADRLAGFVAREVNGGVVYSTPGPPAQFTWSTDDRVVTVVADAPAETLDALLAELPPTKHDDDRSLLARIGNGAGRVVSWLNPFD